MIKDRNVLYQIICAAFCVIVVVSNIISAKMFALPFFHQFSIPAGLITYPLTFLLSDLVTEIYGAKKAKLMVIIAFAMSIMSYVIIQTAILLPSSQPANQASFEKVLGLNGVIIFASLIAYLVGQIIDIKLYDRIKKWTGPRFLWIRNNGSTWASQIVDTLIVNTIFLHWGLGMEMSAVWPIMYFSYAYKAFFSALNTPIFYFLVNRLKKSGLQSV